MRRKDLEEHIDPEPNSGCWLWVGRRNVHGYGVVRWKRPWSRSQYAHRVMWAREHGMDIPHGMTLDHLCRNRACVNPQHLEVVTGRVNILRGQGAERCRSKTACPRGHPYYHLRNANGSRICRVCATANLRRYRAEKREKVQAQ